MANSFAGRVFKLDTSGATSAYTKGPIYIGAMTWKPAAADDVLLVNESVGGNIIWETTALTGTPAGDQSWSNPKGNEPWTGFYLTTLTTGGILYVTIL